MFFMYCSLDLFSNSAAYFLFFFFFLLFFQFFLLFFSTVCGGFDSRSERCAPALSRFIVLVALLPHF